VIVAVTGGTGFVGRRLVSRHLAAGDTVRVLSRRPRSASGLPDAVLSFQGDVRSGAKVLLPFVDGADVLYHCAAELHDEATMSAVHVAGTQSLLEAAEGRIGRLVHLSSVGVYGRAPGGRVTEDSPLNPAGVYEETKAASERLVREAFARGRVRASILRPSKIYGADMRPRDLFLLISIIDRGLFFYVGGAGAVANYVHVDNVVEGLACCAVGPADPCGIYNLSDCRPLEEFVSIIARELGVPAPTMRVPETLARVVAGLCGWVPGFPLTGARVAGLVNRTRYESARIERDLGYRRPVTIENGLREMVAAWRGRTGRA